MIRIPQLVAIDLDGTLLDTVDDLHHAVVLMQKAVSISCSARSDVQSWVGDGIERLVHRALTGAMAENAAEQDFRPALKIFKDAYHRFNGEYSVVYPGVIDSLEWLAMQEVPMVVVTNKAREYTLPLLTNNGIAHFFGHAVCGDDVSSKKPAPEALLRSAEIVGAQPQASVLVGDSLNDFIAARNAAFKLIGVSYGYNRGLVPKDIRGGNRPDVIIDSFRQLPEAIGTLFKLPKSN